MGRWVFFVASAVLACGQNPADPGPIATVTGEDPCDVEACDEECSRMTTECGTRFDGVCVDDECTCEPPEDACVACKEEDCEPFWDCSQWDCIPGCETIMSSQVVACEVVVPDFSLEGFDNMYIKISGTERPMATDCAQTPERWRTVADAEVFELCPDLCAEVQTEGAFEMCSLIFGE